MLRISLKLVSDTSNERRIDVVGMVFSFDRISHDYSHLCFPFFRDSV